MKFPCRTTLEGIEDSVDNDNYDVNEHIAKLTASKVEAQEFVL